MGVNGRKMSNINSTSGSQIPNAGINNSGTATLTRPRPQPITGTPPPDQADKFDQKIIQTCNLFGLNLVNNNSVRFIIDTICELLLSTEIVTFFFFSSKYVMYLHFTFAVYICTNTLDERFYVSLGSVRTNDISR